jgi:peptidoglycan/LPS O-acetylase OafA/YrhL
MIVKPWQRSYHSPLQTKSNLLDLLNFAKGIGIAWIFLAHCDLLNVGWQGVHLFIVLSGLGLTYSGLTKAKATNWKDWYRKRLRRILPAYWLVVLGGYAAFAGLLMLQGNNLIQALWAGKQILFFDMTLLKNFHYEVISTFPNVSLWFVPFIVSFYLLFPWLYRWLRHRMTLQGVLRFLAATIAIEVIYRAIALYWLDGLPVGLDSLKSSFPQLGVPFDRIPSNFLFQDHAPFGFAPSRLAEFALGMVAAVALVRSPHCLHRWVIHPISGVAGLLVWGLGNWLLYQGFVGWLFADMAIALGLTLSVLNLARVLQNTLPAMFKLISFLGDFSYYVFLVHALFIQVISVYLETYSVTATAVPANPMHNILILIKVVIFTALSSYLLYRFDRSRVATWIMRQSVGRVLPAA